jgi:hypothetical protein
MHESACFVSKILTEFKQHLVLNPKVDVKISFVHISYI